MHLAVTFSSNSIYENTGVEMKIHVPNAHNQTIIASHLTKEVSRAEVGNLLRAASHFLIESR